MKFPFRKLYGAQNKISKNNQENDNNCSLQPEDDFQLINKEDLDKLWEETQVSNNEIVKSALGPTGTEVSSLDDHEKETQVSNDAGINQDTEIDYGLSIIGEEIGPEFCNIL